jgi:hypothetical protein
VIALAQRFVPVADEVWRLQQGEAADGTWFRALAQQGHARDFAGSKQGVYACTADGRLLASGNPLGAAQAAALLQRALAAWEALDPAQRAATGQPVDAGPPRWEDLCPVDGLVLERVARDLAAPAGPRAAREPAFNLDHVWFSKDEARQWLPPQPWPGAACELPHALAERLARLVFVDNVRGQTSAFRSEHVREAALRATVRASADGIIALHIDGRAGAFVDGARPRGVRVRVLGRAAFDVESGRFVAFDLAAKGVRWGSTSLNERYGDPGPSPIGFWLTLAPAGRCVPPAYVNLYGAAWTAPSRQ